MPRIPAPTDESPNLTTPEIYFRPLGAVGTSDAGEPAFRIAAVKIRLDHLLDDRPEKTILPLETTLILRQEPVEMMEEYTVKD